MVVGATLNPSFLTGRTGNYNLVNTNDVVVVFNILQNYYQFHNNNDDDDDDVDQTPVLKGAPPSPPQRSYLVRSCMNSHRRYLSHRTSKFSSNRHRKLQPFRET